MAISTSTQIVTLNQSYEVTPVITTDAYTAGDALGSKLTVSATSTPIGGSAFIESVAIFDKGANSTAIDVIFFSEDPDSTTITDNAALDIADVDLNKINSMVSMTATDYVAFNDNSAGFLKNLGIPVALAATNRTLYAAMVERGTPTRAVGDLILQVNIVWVGQ